MGMDGWRRARALSSGKAVAGAAATAGFEGGPLGRWQVLRALSGGRAVVWASGSDKFEGVAW